jgi:transposase-like protein
LAKGESITDIARELQVAASSSRNFRRRLREVFEVNDDQELLAHPDIIRQIKEED